MNLNEVIKNLLAIIPSRQRDILEQRFGLNGKKKTLAAAGKKYGLTRERVRQIEAAGLKLLNAEFKKNAAANKILNDCLNHLEQLGGVIKEENFLKELKALLKDKNLTTEQLNFFFGVVGKPEYYRENDDFYGFWHLNKESLKFAVDFVNKLAKFLADKKEDLITHKKFDELFSQAIKPHNLKDFIALNYVAISKKFGVSPFGDFGLNHWDEINPKTARAKTYLILKKHGKPLHFKEIAKRINELVNNRRRVLYQTIHNELIKDQRFVLVGRGMYGLAESGHKPGIAKDVIARVLKSKGPLRKEEVVDLVKQERFLADNTILLNLQNKKHFKRLTDGRYHIK